MRLIGIAALSLMLIGGSAVAEEVLDDSFPANAPMTFDQMQKAVPAEFDDPHSGQYKSLSVQEGDSGPVLCGFANFKNAAGGYAPFQPFVVELRADGPWATIPSKHPAIELDIVAHSPCQKALGLKAVTP